MKRRDFLSISTKAGASSLLLRFDLNVAIAQSTSNQNPNNKEVIFPSAYLSVNTNNELTFTLDKVEMGQNVITSLRAIFAQAFDMDSRLISIELPSLGSKEINPLYQPSWGTGGSTSVRSMWQPLIKAGQTSKKLFLLAAARHWKTNPENLSIKNAVITHLETNQTIKCGDLIASANSIPAQDIELLNIQPFTWKNEFLTRTDNKNKVSGKQIYAIDLNLKNQKYAYIMRPPHIKGELLEYDINNVLENKKISKIFPVSNGLAIVADSFWEASQASRSISVKWKKKDTINSKTLEKKLITLLGQDGNLARKKGNTTKAIDELTTKMSVIYSVPLLAHCTMEPMNCTAWVHDGICEIWAPTQRPQLAREVAAQTLGISIDNVILHSQSLGGGFGRRLKQDYVVEAVEIAKQSDAPITLTWSREDDIQHGFFRPMVAAKFSAALNNGSIAAWHSNISALENQTPKQKSNNPGLNNIKKELKNFLTSLKNKFEGKTFQHHYIIEGATELPYQIDNIQINWQALESNVPVGPWRSVAHSYNAFFIESFIDELANLANQDPINFRERNINNPRLKKTLTQISKASEWKEKHKNKNIGVASYSCLGSYISLVLELDMNKLEKGEIKIKKVTSVVDCGTAIDPDGIKAQIEGGIIFGLSAALYGEITIEDTTINQNNFHNYRLLTIDEAPKIETHILASNQAPGGVGELSTPVVAPALCNALFNATGHRFRKLPLQKQFIDTIQ